MSKTRSRRGDFQAQVLGDAPHRHLRVWRHDRSDTLICWDDLQAIKNEMLGEDVAAIEVFPREAAVVNEANMRHLWEVDPERIPGLLR